MSRLVPERKLTPSATAPLLCNGDRMKQPEFHHRYERCPEGDKWELVGGIVYLYAGRTGITSSGSGLRSGCTR